MICYSWAAVSTPPYERLPPFSTPHDPRAGVQRENGTGAYILARVWAPAFSRRSNFRAQSRVARPRAQAKPPAQNAVREQRTRNRSTRPYFDTLVTFLWYALLISGGLRSVGWGTSLPRVTTLSFPPLFLVCNTLLLNGGARNTRGRPWRGARFAPVRWASALGGCRTVESQSHPPAARWLTQGEPNVRHEPVDRSADCVHTSPPLTGR